MGTIDGTGGLPTSPQKHENFRKGLLGDENDEGGGAGEGDAGITLEQILALKERFDSADQDGGGSLDMQEFMDAFGSIINKDGSMTQEQIARLFMQIDANSDGGIDWNEFSTYMLMESQSSGTVKTHQVANFFLPDPLGKKADPDWFHRESADCMLIDSVGGQYLTASKDGTMRLWTASSMQLAKTIVTGQSWILAICWLTRSARLVVSTADRKIRFYDVHTWEQVVEVQLQSPAFCVCSWTYGEAELLAMGNEKGEVTVIDISKGLKEVRPTGKEKKQKKRPDYWNDSVTKVVHDGFIEQMEMVEDLGGLVTCGADSAIVIFEYPLQSDPNHKDKIIPRRILKHARGHQKGVKCFQWVQSHKLIVSGGLERQVVIWNPYTCKPVVSLDGHQSGIAQVQVNAEFEQVISLSTDGVVKVWDLRNNECLQSLSEGENLREKGARNTSMVYDAARHRLITCGLCPHKWTINPQILTSTTDVTHRSPVVAALYNKNFGHVVTVAEDSEVTIWKPTTGNQVFNFVDQDRDAETFLSAAAFDDNGRRLLTGDHHGRVRVWNFSNGACIKTLVKPTDAYRRQEITGLTMYQYEETRFFAASSWDRKISVWVDDSNDSGTVDPFLQIGGNDDDILTIAFTYPKILATGASDGCINMFDIESGARRLSMACTKPPSTGNTPRQTGSTTAELSNMQYVEKVIFLEQRNKTVVSVGGDGHIRFWEGVWMEQSPPSLQSSMLMSRLAVVVPSGHWPEFGLVETDSDDANKVLVTCDEGGYIKVWDISGYDWQAPSASQVRATAFWRAHSLTISAVNLIPAPADNPERGVLLLTASADKRVLLWSADGVLVGQFGQASPWDVENPSTWAAGHSSDILSDVLQGLFSVMSDAKAGEDGDDEEERDILRELDDRLRKKPSSSVQFKVSPMKQLPAELPSRKGKKGRDYEVDLLTGDRVYKNAPPKKNAVGEERQRPPMSQYLKHFAKKLDPDNVVGGTRDEKDANAREVRVGTPNAKGQ